MGKRGTLLLILGYLAVIIISLLAVILSSISSVLTPNPINYLITFIIFLSVALLTYTYFSNFNFKETSTLYNTLIISILISGVYYFLISLINKFLIALAENFSKLSQSQNQLGTSPELILDIFKPENVLTNYLIVIPIIIIVYNIFPIIFLIKNKND